MAKKMNDALKSRIMGNPDPSTTISGGEGEAGKEELNRIMTDDNTKATPATNAIHIEIVLSYVMYIEQLVLRFQEDFESMKEIMRTQGLAQPEVKPEQPPVETSPAVPEAPVPGSQVL